MQEALEAAQSMTGKKADVKYVEEEPQRRPHLLRQPT